MTTRSQYIYLITYRLIVIAILLDSWYYNRQNDSMASVVTTTLSATAVSTVTTAFVAVPTTTQQRHPNLLSNNNDDHIKSQHQQNHQHQPHHGLIPSQIFRPLNLKKRKPAPQSSGTTRLHAVSTDSILPVSHQQRVLLSQHHVPQRSHPKSSVAASTTNARAPSSSSTSLHAAIPSSTTTTTATILVSEPTKTEEISTTDGNLKRGRRRNRTQRKKRAAMAEKKASFATGPTIANTNTLSIVESVLLSTPALEETTNATTTTTTTAHHLSGNLPDIYWRSIPMEHLRYHPNFVALPEPNTIRQLYTMDDVKQFRQESWQWDTLHHGRCTTSQAVAALGFLEAKTGEELGVPMSWRRGGMGAFVRLSVQPLRTLQEMNDILIVPNDNPNIHSSSNPVASKVSQVSGKNDSIWAQQTGSHTESTDSVRIGFAAKYQYRISMEQQQERKKYARKISQNENMCKSIRMMWGNTQEATALLTAINYFTKLDPNFRLEEVGMCGAGLSLNVTSSTSMHHNNSHDDVATTISSSLLIGATPDGILRHSNGLIEVLEVKNHCPFFSNSFPGKKGSKNRGGVRKRFSLSSMPFDDKSNGVFAHYVPQLQLEMLCVGPECHSAVMIRQTATAGAVILRMHRDNEWIEEMLYWLHRFQLDYVEPKKPPPRNFFWDTPNHIDRARYRRFVNKTKEIRNSRVELVARIHNEDIQRMGDHTSLFLD